MNLNLVELANTSIKKCDTAYLGVIDQDGFPSVSTVSLINPENIFELYFSSNLDGNKAKRLANNNKASVCCNPKEGNITLVGETELLTDQESKSRHWLSWFNEIYEGGETDLNYVIIKFTAKRASLWLKDDGAEFTIEELKRTQSK